jgi:hypothetical protein
MGTCKLCRRNEVELKDSHLLPANIYKKIRRSEGANNSLVVASKQSFRFSDKQISDYVLCGECEQRFGAVENFVSRQCLQDDGSFPLRDAVVAQPRLDDDPELAAISGKAAQIDVNFYVYFASSILWRTGAHVWRNGLNRVTIELGLYQEQLRLYLLGRASFPTDIVIAIFVAVAADTKDQYATTPVRLDTQGYHHYELVIPGIQFGIVLGQRMPKEVRGGCLLRSDENLVFLTDHLDRRSMKALLRTARVTKRVQEGADLYKKPRP